MGAFNQPPASAQESLILVTGEELTWIPAEVGIQGSLLLQGQGIQVGREGTHQVEQDKPQAGQGSLGGK